MATERCRRRGDKRKSKRAPRSEAPAGPTSVHDVPGHLLELILLRLDSSTSLLRAAVACKRWRRVVADTAFLSRFRSLHTPCVAGYYQAVDPGWADQRSQPISDRPVFLPSSSVAVDSRHFSLDFLPHSDSGWNLADSRGSLLLLFKKRTGWAARAQGRCLPDLVVCEPMTRRCQGILSPGKPSCLGAFLLDGDHTNDGSGGRAIGMSSFKVLAVLHENHTSEPRRSMPVACVFSSGSDGGWRLLPSASTDGEIISLPRAVESVSFAGRVNGSLYWVTGEDGGAMLALDEATMAFSRVPFMADDFSGSYDRWRFRVIGGGGGGGALRVVRLVSNELQVFARLPGSGGEEWVVEKMVRLPEATRGLPGRVENWYFRRDAMIVVANEAYVLLTPQEKTWLFSVELETLEVERKHERNKYPGEAFPCQLLWPPALEACDDRGRQRRHR